MAKLTDLHNPSFVLWPINNNRTAWREFGLPVILVVPHRRRGDGSAVANSAVSRVRIYIEDVPKEARVAGHDHVGLRFPDRELYARTLNIAEVNERIIALSSVTIQNSDGDAIDIKDAQDGDIITYTTASGVTDTIEYLSNADYFDVSDILLDLELLPPDQYNLVYETEYFKRVISSDGRSDFLCIDVGVNAIAVLRLNVDHPGKVINEFYKNTPVPYVTAAKKSEDTTVAFYRPFTDALNDVMDEQNLLERINWVSSAPPEAIPYLSALLGWDLPYFPQSLDKLRRAMLRRTVEFQNLKGSRRAVTNIFRLFGFEVLISNLWWSSDGLRLIRPDERLPLPYQSEEITIKKQCQIDPLLYDIIPSKFITETIPLLFRPQEKVGLDRFVALSDIGDVTIDAYIVTYQSDAYNALVELSDQLKSIPAETSCEGLIAATIGDLSVQGYSQLFVTGKHPICTAGVIEGKFPPLLAHNVSFNRETNELNLTVSQRIDDPDLRLFAFATYVHYVNDVPAAIKDLQSNRFDLQVLSKTLDDVVDPTTLEFAIEFLYRLKAFHSLLRVIRTRVELTEVYPITDICVGGDIEQRWDIDIGRQQVPPAIIPRVPSELTDCSILDPLTLGYKESDIIYRLRELANLPLEHAAWKSLDGRETSAGDQQILPNQPDPTRDLCTYNPYGQDRILIQDREEARSFEYAPSPTANQNVSGKPADNELSPIDLSSNGDYNADGPEGSSNKASGQYGKFIREYTVPKDPLCTLDKITDHCYKGRANDELLHQSIILLPEIVRNAPCSISLGAGTYWTYPSYSKSVTYGVAHPARSSKTGRMKYSGGATGAGQQIFLDTKQRPYLEVSYDQKLPNRSESFLGRLYRDYHVPVTETLHFTNRDEDPRPEQFRQLALERPSLDIHKPTLHFPGCRFPMLNALEEDFEHPTWRARPWDDLYSTYCGPAHICGTPEPTFLNARLERREVTSGPILSSELDEYFNVVDGNEYLVFDDLPYKELGNGLLPDISSLGDHSLTSAAVFTESEVVHKVYMRDANANPAVTFEQECDFDFTPAADVAGTEIDYLGRLHLDEERPPLYTSHQYCDSGTLATNPVVIDYADGYACVYGMTENVANETSAYDELFEELGVPNFDLTGHPEVLFLLGSGIRFEQGMRLDCGCLLVECGEVGETAAEDGGSGICASAQFFDDETGDYDFSQDKLSVIPRVLLKENVGVCSTLLNGKITSLFELA